MWIEISRSYQLIASVAPYPLLFQAFPSGVPDQEVQMLDSVSRVASIDDISKWNITTIDTLAALMKTEDGTWETAQVLHEQEQWHQSCTCSTFACFCYYILYFFRFVQSKEIITKYLSTSGNSLGSSELTIINSNLCSLNTSTLLTITPESIRLVSADWSEINVSHQFRLQYRCNSVML